MPVGTEATIALPILDLGARRWWVVNPMPWPLYLAERDPVPIVQEGEWAWELVWMGPGNLAHSEVRTPEDPACNEPLY